jgi:hypothetical protein
MVLIGGVWWLRIGAYDVGLYLEMWIVGAASLVVLNGGFGVLAAAGQPTRRRAILLVAVLPFVFIGSGFASGSLLTYANPIRGPIVMYFLASPNPDLHRMFS